MFIYLITNHVTGKHYIGQHKGDNLQKYFQTKLSDAFHNRGGQSRLYASMRKHGRTAFTIRPLVSGIQTKTDLDQKEREYIALYRSTDLGHGYNICHGGEGFTGPHTDESKRKCSVNSARYWKGKKRPKETYDKIKTTKCENGALTKFVEGNRDPDLISKRVATRKARNNYGIYVPSHLGKRHSDETKKVMRQKRLAYLAALLSGNKSASRPEGTAWCSGHKLFLPVAVFGRRVRAFCKECRRKDYLNSKIKKGLSNASSGSEC